MILRDTKDELARVAALVGATFVNKSFPELQKFVQQHDFTTPLISLIPVTDIGQNIMESSAVRYRIVFDLYFLTKFQKSDTLENNKDEKIDVMLALSQAFYRELHKNDALVFSNPLFTWRNELTRQFTSNLLLGCKTRVELETSCTRVPSPLPPPSPPENWDELIAMIGRGYAYPQQTGQTTVFRTGDDADTEATVFAPIRAANSLMAVNSLANFFTLNNTNVFGNTNRFTDSVGGQNYDGTDGSLIDYVVDNYTALAFLRTAQTFKTWNDAIDAINSSANLGFTDWFMPNKSILNSIRNEGDTSTHGLNYSPLNIANSNYWLSTTNPTTTLNAFRVVSSHTTTQNDKTTIQSSFLARKHF